jgi:MFS family permease
VLDHPGLLSTSPSMHTPASKYSSQNPLLEYDEDPANWPLTKKWPLSIIVIMMSTTLALFSGMHAAAISAIAHYYQCPELTVTAGISVFLLGFASGPLLFAPLSEMLGRIPIFRITLLLFLISNVGCALAPNIGTLLTFRFLGGFFGSPTGQFTTHFILIAD